MLVKVTNDKAGDKKGYLEMYRCGGRCKGVERTMHTHGFSGSEWGSFRSNLHKCRLVFYSVFHHLITPLLHTLNLCIQNQVIFLWGGERLRISCKLPFGWYRAWKVLPSGFFPFRFPHQNPVYASPLPHMHYMPYPSHFLYLITQITFGECRSLSSSICSFLHPHVTSSLLGPNIFLSTLLSNTVSPHSSPQCKRPRFTPIQTSRQYYNSVYLDFYIFG